MDVKVNLLETQQPLEKKMRIECSAGGMEASVRSKLLRIGARARMNGFRPGKVPMHILEQKYGPEIRGEIVNRRMMDAFREALEDQSLKAAGGVHFGDVDASNGRWVKFTASFEVFPEINPVDLARTEVKAVKVSIGDADVEKAIERVQESHADWIPVEREAQQGDQITISYTGSADGEPVSGGEGSDMPLIIGSQSLIPGFEEQLTGLKEGDEKTFTCVFPENYGEKRLRGKEVEFRCRVNRLAEKKLPALSEKFIRSIGVEEGTVEALKVNIRSRLQSSSERMVYNVNRSRIIDLLLKTHTFPVPSALIETESIRLLEQARQRRKMAGLQVDSKDVEPDDQTKKEARKRVKVGLLFSELIRRHDIKLDTALMEEMIAEQVRTYPDPQKARSFFLKDEKISSDLENAALEKQVIGLIMAQASLRVEELSFDELRHQQAE